MVEHARANADQLGNGEERRPSFLVGDAASLAFPDGSFDLVVSTFSMHHWADPTAGLAEIGRVLRPGPGRSSGTSGPAAGQIRSGHATRTCPTRWSTCGARRFGS
jgi:ubiquinone/menaquinone biosynthesis C-methylase UbiE